MRSLALGTASLLFALNAAAQMTNPEPADCGAPLTAVATCDEQETGGSSPFQSLNPAEIDRIVRAAAAALNRNDLTIAVVDRAGRPLAVWRGSAADPINDNRALGTARTSAFFSHNQAPLSSRTVRFIGATHFPTGVDNTASAALYGIENTNRGCDFNAEFNPGKCIPRARNLSGNPCNAFDQRGCSQERISEGGSTVSRPLGIFTGKVFEDDPDPEAVNAGGVPLYRVRNVQRALDAGRLLPDDGKPVADMIGAVGVYGLREDEDPQIAEYAAVIGAFGPLNAVVASQSGAGAIVPVPFFPLPQPGNVFIDGIRLPFLGRDIKLTFSERGSTLNGLPNGAQLLEDQSAGTAANFTNGRYIIEPRPGGCAANRYLVGPKAGSRLSAADVDAIVKRADATAKRTRAAIRLPLSRYARMVISVADVDGTLLAVYRMPDATIFSIDVSVAKARNVIHFSTSSDLEGVPPGTAVTNRSIAFGSQPFFPSGISGKNFKPKPGPFYEDIFLRDLDNACSQGLQPANPNQNGVVFFAGATPLFRGDQMVGGLGVSGDGIEQDDYVTFMGAGDLVPARNKWADRVVIDKVRLPMFKFPRQPEGVKECDGGPCT
jgi:uncharacterized protein GlcG (DUF336 family)